MRDCRLNHHGHLLAAIDFETTGLDAGHHEPVQIAVVPLNGFLRPAGGVAPFYTTIRPLHPDRADPGAMLVNKLNLDDLAAAPEPDDVAERLVDYVQQLELRVGGQLVPLAHNWAFESSFLHAWLGRAQFDVLFNRRARDTMSLAASINDRYQLQGQKAPFMELSLDWLCKHFNIQNAHPHDALWDCLVEAELYRHLLLS